MTNSDETINLYNDLFFDDVDYNSLGRRILNVTTLFETTLSIFVRTESEAIGTIIEALPPEVKASLPDLLTYNETTRDIICSLSEIKEEVIEELDLGNEIAKAQEL